MTLNTKYVAVGLLVILLVAGGLYYRNGEKAPSKQETATTDQATTTIATGTQDVPVTVVQNPTITVTQADNGKTVTVKKGTRVVIALGEDNWTLNLDPQGIINRIKYIAVMRGVQGIYTADVVGSTKLSGEGRPNCNPGEVCAQYIVDFNTTIVVTK